MNRNTLCKLFIFTVGAAIGSAVTWKVVKTKYEQIAQGEIDSVKEEYMNLMRSVRQKDFENSDTEEDHDEYYPDDDERDFTESEQQQIEYHKITAMYRGSDDEEIDEKGGTGDEDEVPYINGPYVIAPDDFGSGPPGYNAQPLDYFKDGVLADNWGVIMNIDDTIGEEALNHFGDYVDDVVHVRNDRTEIDYEVTRDPRTYDEAIRTNPNPYYGQ